MLNVVYVFILVTSNPRLESPSSISLLAFAEAGYRMVVLFPILGSSVAKTFPVAFEGEKATSSDWFDDSKASLKMLAVPDPTTPILTRGIPAALHASRKTEPASGEVMITQSNA